MIKNIDSVGIAQFKREYFKQFQELFIKEFGFYFAENRAEHFRSLLINYIKNSSYDNYNDFYNYLAHTIPGKILLQKIIDDVTIGETYFFRNEPQLEMLVKHVLPELI